MIGRLQPYPAYKDSCVSWLGDLPAHWTVRKLAHLGTFLKGGGIARADITENGVPALTYGDIYTQYNLSIKALRKYTTPQVATKAQPIVNGDVLFTASGESLEEIGKTVLYAGEEVGYAGGDIIILRPNQGDGRYLSYALNSEPGLQQKSAFGRGDIIVHISSSKLRQISIPFPPHEEQQAITRFLDHIDHRINRYIRAKRRLIALLNEQKQAIIHRAVTRGLDPDAPLKPSGVEWLGEIPAHWEVRRIGQCLSSTVAGIWGDEPDDRNSPDHIICVRVADFDMESLGVSTKKLTLRSVPRSAQERRLLQPGDLLMEKSGGGDAEPVGRVVRFTLGRPAVSSNFITRLRPDCSVVHSDFLLYVLYVLQSTRRNIPSIKQTTGIQNIDERHYFANMVGLPPLDEQQQILNSISSSLARIGGSIDSARRQIDLMREYRTRLIADVVTGKLDVRGVALPEDAEAGEAELFDEMLDEEGFDAEGAEDGDE